MSPWRGRDLFHTGDALNFCGSVSLSGRWEGRKERALFWRRETVGMGEP